MQIKQIAANALTSIKWYLTLRATILSLLGTILVFNPTLSADIFIKILGVYLLVDGSVSALTGNNSIGERRMPFILRGLLIALSGLLVLFNGTELLGITFHASMFLLATVMLLNGGMEIVSAFWSKSSDAEMEPCFFSGLLVVLFGLTLLFAPEFYGKNLLRIMGVLVLLSAAVLFFLGNKVSGFKNAIGKA